MFCKIFGEMDGDVTLGHLFLAPYCSKIALNKMEGAFFTEMVVQVLSFKARPTLLGAGDGVHWTHTPVSLGDFCKCPATTTAECTAEGAVGTLASVTMDRTARKGFCAVGARNRYVLTACQFDDGKAILIQVLT